MDSQKEVIYTKGYGIASVPTLKLFRHTPVVETLHGYQSEHDILKILDQHVIRDSDQVLAKVIEENSQGHSTQAYELIVNAIVDDPKNARLPLAMCKLLKHEERYAEAIKLIKILPDELREDAELQFIYELMMLHQARNNDLTLEQLDDLIAANDADLELKRQRFIQLISEQEIKLALQQLVAIMEREHGFDNNYAQLAMLRVFALLAERYPLISTFRSSLNRYTY